MAAPVGPIPNDPARPSGGASLRMRQRQAGSASTSGFRNRPPPRMTTRRTVRGQMSSLGRGAHTRRPHRRVDRQARSETSVMRTLGMRTDPRATAGLRPPRLMWPMGPTPSEALRSSIQLGMRCSLRHKPLVPRCTGCPGSKHDTAPGGHALRSREASPVTQSSTITLPMLAPVNSMLSASGARSSPWTTCSAWMILPSASQPASSSWALGKRST